MEKLGPRARRREQSGGGRRALAVGTEQARDPGAEFVTEMRGDVRERGVDHGGDRLGLAGGGQDHFSMSPREPEELESFCRQPQVARADRTRIIPPTIARGIRAGGTGGLLANGRGAEGMQPRATSALLGYWSAAAATGCVELDVHRPKAIRDFAPLKPRFCVGNFARTKERFCETGSCRKVRALKRDHARAAAARAPDEKLVPPRPQ